MPAAAALTLLLFSLLSSVVLAGFTMDEAMAIHPDGTPVNPAAMQEAMRKGETPELVEALDKDPKLVDLVANADVDTFRDYMALLHQEHIFYSDGTAKDVVAWRQSVLDDEYYDGLLKEAAPDFHRVIHAGDHREIQEYLKRAHKVAQAGAGAKSEL